MYKNLLNSMSNAFASKTGKRVFIGVIVLAVLGGVGVGGAHYYKSYQRDKIMTARSEMIRAEAKNNNITLLSEAQIRTIVAASMGVPEDKVSFKWVTLVSSRYDSDDCDDFFDDKDDCDDNKDKRKDDRDNHRNRRANEYNDIQSNRPDRNLAQPNMAPQGQPIPAAPGQPTQGQPIPQAQPSAPGQPMPATQAVPQPPAQPPLAHPQHFDAVYKVTASANGVTYRFIIDPVSGTVIRNDIHN